MGIFFIVFQCIFRISNQAVAKLSLILCLTALPEEEYWSVLVESSSSMKLSIIGKDCLRWMAKMWDTASLKPQTPLFLLSAVEICLVTLQNRVQGGIVVLWIEEATSSAMKLIQYVKWKVSPFQFPIIMTPSAAFLHEAWLRGFIDCKTICECQGYTHIKTKKGGKQEKFFEHYILSPVEDDDTSPVALVPVA